MKEKEYKIINSEMLFEILNEDFINEMIFKFFGILDIPIQYVFNENENAGGIKFLDVMAYITTTNIR